MSEPTLFTKIIRGEIPSHKLYEDEHVFAFLDIGPLSPGHALVIPKEEVATLDALSDEAAAAKGDMAFSVGLMVLLMVVTVAYMPLVLPVLIDGVEVEAWDMKGSRPAAISR